MSCWNDGISRISNPQKSNSCGVLFMIHRPLRSYNLHNIIQSENGAAVWLSALQKALICTVYIMSA